MQKPRDRRCVPFFRYFGPTAIVPGFKQVVVEVGQDHLTSLTTSKPHDESEDARSCGSEKSEYARTGQSPITPVYKRGDLGPLSPWIRELAECFFKNPGCNYPSLSRKGS